MKILTFIIIAAVLGLLFWLAKNIINGLYKISLDNYLKTLDFSDHFERYARAQTDKDKERILYEAKKEILKYSK